MSETMQIREFITLHFETEPDTSVSVSTIAVSLLEFEKIAREIAARTDPFIQFELTLERTETGSLRFLTNLKDKLDYKRVREVALAIIIALFMQPVAEDKIRPILEKYGLVSPEMSDEDIDKIAKAVVSALKDEEIQRSRNGFYNAIEADDSVTAVGARTDHGKGKPDLLITRDEFPDMSLAADSPTELEAVSREIPVETTLTLEVPVLRKSSKAKWTFRSGGGKVSASIKDVEFLDNALSGRLEIPLIEGVEFNVILAEHQEFRDGAWHHNSYSIRKVLNWRPPGQSGLFLSNPSQ